MVHFFLYDYRFERVWKNPDSDLERLSWYRAVLSPDFSMYLEMAPVIQLYNTFRNRWCGAYWASKGMRVIPTVNWGDESTFDFCFEGIEGESLLLLLDDKGVAASSGSACTSGALDPSHVLLAIGRPHEVAHGSLRLTLDRDNTMGDVEAIAKATAEVVNYLRGMSPVWKALQRGERSYVIQ